VGLADESSLSPPYLFMKLHVAILLAGGEGSGPTAPCPQCGPKGGVQYSAGNTKAAVRDYQDMSSALNPAIRKGDLPSHTQFWVNRLDQAFDHHGKVFKNKTLYRGVGFWNFPGQSLGTIPTREGLDTYFKGMIGQEYSDKAFMSTSRSERGAGEWGSVILRIHTGEQGLKGIDVSSLTGVKAFKKDPNIKESEIMFPRETKFKVTEASSTVKGGKTRYYLDLVPV